MAAINTGAAPRPPFPVPIPRVPAAPIAPPSAPATEPATPAQGEGAGLQDLLAAGMPSIPAGYSPGVGMPGGARGSGRSSVRGLGRRSRPVGGIAGHQSAGGCGCAGVGVLIWSCECWCGPGLPRRRGHRSGRWAAGVSCLDEPVERQRVQRDGAAAPGGQRGGGHGFGVRWPEVRDPAGPALLPRPVAPTPVIRREIAESRRIGTRKQPRLPGRIDVRAATAGWIRTGPQHPPATGDQIGPEACRSRGTESLGPRIRRWKAGTENITSISGATGSDGIRGEYVSLGEHVIKAPRTRHTAPGAPPARTSAQVGDRVAHPFRGGPQRRGVGPGPQHLPRHRRQQLPG